MGIPADQLAIAMGLSFILIAVIIACANFIQWFGREQAIKRAASQPLTLEDVIVPPKHFILLRVLLDKDEHASLSTFQFLMWTLLIAFLYISLWFLQLHGGSTEAPPAIPDNLMALMGISVAVPIASKGIAEYKKLKLRPEGVTYTEPRYASMLEEDGQPSLLRLQMFLWTIAALVIYFAQFLVAASKLEPNAVLGLQQADPTLLFLMGLSQTGDLGSKAYSGTVKKTEPDVNKPAVAPPATADPGTARNILAIRETIPRTARPKELVTLLGSGFGIQKDTIMLGQERVPPESIGRWEDTRIEFTIPDTITPGNQNLRVIAAGNAAEVPDHRKWSGMGPWTQRDRCGYRQ